MNFSNIAESKTANWIRLIASVLGICAALIGLLRYAVPQVELLKPFAFVVHFPLWLLLLIFFITLILLLSHGNKSFRAGYSAARIANQQAATAPNSEYAQAGYDSEGRAYIEELQKKIKAFEDPEFMLAREIQVILHAVSGLTFEDLCAKLDIPSSDTESKSLVRRSLARLIEGGKVKGNPPNNWYWLVK